jgi:hypothetical protein
MTNCFKKTRDFNNLILKNQLKNQIKFDLGSDYWEGREIVFEKREILYLIREILCN